MNEAHEKKLQVIAQHEAGHAVACLIFGIQTEYINIYNDNRLRGDHKRKPLSEAQPHYVAIVGVSGEAAQWEFTGREPSRDDTERDRHMMYENLRPEVANALREQYLPLLREMFRRSEVWRVVQAVAEALVEKRPMTMTLTGEEIERIARPILTEETAYDAYRREVNRIAHPILRKAGYIQ